MERFLWFAVGAFARVLSMVAAYYSDWLFDRLLDGAEAGLDFMADVREFFDALVGVIVQRITGRRVHGYDREYDEGYRPGLFAG